MSITRRVFLRNSALAAVGTAALPSFLTRAAYGAADLGSRPKRLIVIFQRGAADGLNIVVPHGEAHLNGMHRRKFAEQLLVFLFAAAQDDQPAVFPGKKFLRPEHEVEALRRREPADHAEDRPLERRAPAEFLQQLGSCW